jgi:hypothetical protein
LFLPHNGIGHARYARHHFHIMHANYIRAAHNPNRNCRSRTFNALVGWQIQAVADE